MEILSTLSLVWTNVDFFNVSHYPNTSSKVTTEPEVHSFCPFDPEYDTAPFPSCYSWLQIIVFALFMAFVMFVIVFGNLMVIISVLTNTSLKTVQNYLLVSLAVADCCVGALIMPFSLANELMGYWAFGDILCDSWLSLDVLLCTASIYSLCAISLDRYWSVTQAVTYLQRRTPRRAALMIGAVWLTSLIVSVPPLFGWKNPPLDREVVEFHNATVRQTTLVKICSVGEDTSEYVVFSSLLSFWVPLGIITFVYARIYMVAQSRASGANKRPTGANHIAAKIAPVPVVKNNDNHASNRGLPPSTLAVVADTHLLNNSAHSVTNNSSATTRTASSNAGERKPLLSKVTPGRLPQTAEESNSSPGSHSTPSDLTSSSSERKRKSTSPTVTHRKCDAAVQTDEPDAMMPFFDDDEFADTSSIMLLSEYDFDDRWREFFDRYFIVPEPTVPQCKPKSEASNGHLSLAHVAVISTESKPFLTRLREFFLPLLRRSIPTRGYKLQINRTPSKALQQKKKKSKRVKKTKEPTDFQEQEDRRKKKLQKLKERRATLVVTLVIATFVACWMPFFIILPLQAICGPQVCEIDPRVFAAVFWLGYFNSALNPVIYTIFNRDFRKAFKRVLLGNAYARNKVNNRQRNKM